MIATHDLTKHTVTQQSRMWKRNKFRLWKTCQSIPTKPCKYHWWTDGKTREYPCHHVSPCLTNNLIRKWWIQKDADGCTQTLAFWLRLLRRLLRSVRAGSYSFQHGSKLAAILEEPMGCCWHHTTTNKIWDEILVRKWLVTTCNNGIVMDCL